MGSTGLNSSVQETDVVAARADIVVALTSYNHASTVGSVARAAKDALSTYFGSTEAKIVLADAGSTDGTREAARNAVGTTSLVEVEYPRPAPALAGVPYHGFPGRSQALRAVLQAAQRLDAKACALVDAGVQTIVPQRIEQLIRPVLNGDFDYVSAYYTRHAYDGAITKGIVYPMFRALYGVALRQPAASEFGCSARLLANYLEQDFWDLENAPVGIDLWLAVAAAAGAFKPCEVALGVRRSVTAATPDLSTTLAQVVGALFTDLENHVDVWQRVRGALRVPVFGATADVEPDAPSVNPERLIESFRLGYRELREIWTWVLPPKTIIELRRLCDAPIERFRFDDTLWAGIIYDFAFGHGLRVLPRDHLLRSLTPLYTGWMASFILQVRGAGSDVVTERLEQVCLAFEAQKRYLISRWRWPERFRR
jgi:hypothetical protein